MKLGQSVIIKGEVQTSEDLVLNGQVEGRIDLPRHVLTVGIGARVRAEIVARSVIVLGAVAGRVTALEHFDLRAGGTMDGLLTTPKLAMADGALFHGTIDMPKPVDGRTPPGAP